MLVGKQSIQSTEVFSFRQLLFPTSSWVQLVIAQTCLRMDRDLTLWWVWFTVGWKQMLIKNVTSTKRRTSLTFKSSKLEAKPGGLVWSCRRIFPPLCLCRRCKFSRSSLRMKNESEAQLSAQTNKQTKSGAIFHVLEAGCPGRWMRAGWPLLRGMEGRDHSVCATDAYHCVQVALQQHLLQHSIPASFLSHLSYFPGGETDCVAGDEDHLIPSLCEM